MQRVRWIGILMLGLALGTCEFAPALAEDTDSVLTFGGASVGYTVRGPDSHEMFTTYWAGARIKKIDADNMVFAAYQHGKIEDAEAGDGGKVLFATQCKNLSGFWFVGGLGFLTNIAEEGDNSHTTGITVDGGFSVDFSDYANLTLLGTAVDRGPRFSWMLNGGFTIWNPEKLLPFF